MRLNVSKTITQESVMGIHAGILKDDVNGNVLIIQARNEQLHVKLSDLISFINEQETASGSKGDSVDE